MSAGAFPLYAAPLSDSSEYVGAGDCSLCGQTVADRFLLGIGDSVICDCDSCGRQLAFAADDHGDATATDCPHCGASVVLRSLPDPVAICTDCLRTGRAALTKDTEYGAVDWEHATAGRTHGYPAPRRTAFSFDQPGEVLNQHGEDEWVSVEFPPAVLLDLVRTPTYSTWQGEVWLFCCDDAMVYMGGWTREEIESEFPGDPEALTGDICLHAFQCRHCGSRRRNYDMS